MRTTVVAKIALGSLLGGMTGSGLFDPLRQAIGNPQKNEQPAFGGGATGSGGEKGGSPGE